MFVCVDKYILMKCAAVSFRRMASRANSSSCCVTRWTAGAFMAGGVAGCCWQGHTRQEVMVIEAEGALRAFAIYSSMQQWFLEGWLPELAVAVGWYVYVLRC
jgi:hypothetical protein